MKVLFLTSWYPHTENPNSGIFIRDQAELARVENEVMVVFSTVDYTKSALSSATVTHSEYKGIAEYRIVVRRSLPLFNQLNYLLLALWNTWKISKKFRPDVIQANVSYPNAVFARVLGYLLKCRYVVIEHTRITNHFRSSFHQWATRYGLRGASARFAVSCSLAEEIRTWLKQEVSILPNVVDTGRFAITPFRDTIPQLGFLGALNTPVKGLDILLRALSGIQRDYKIHIGGRGELLETYKTLATELGISSKCEFYGFVPHGELPSFMAKLHFFVSSSRYETFGVVIAEALASGLPVVATKSGGPDDFVDASNGIFVPTENKAELTNALSVMMDSYRNYDRDAIAQAIVSRFSMNVIRQKLQTIYETCSTGKV